MSLKEAYSLKKANKYWVKEEKRRCIFCKVS